VTPDGTPSPAPLRLDLLGRIGLWSGGEELREVLVQPKRFALLTYVVLRRPGGFLRRDELLGAFWADSTEDRARAALRQALRFLRGHLGKGVLVNRGHTEVGVERGTLQCDVLTFLQALEEGDDEAAVEAYGGNLLPGFLLDGAHEFDRWMHVERQRFRRTAVEAALRLGEQAEEEGDLERGAERVRWALQLVPTNEAVGRRLISLLARAGNRSGALAAYERLADRLRRDLDLEPSPETVELRDSVQVTAGAESAPASGGPALAPQRILVLTLENLTGDPRLDTLGRLAADTLAQGLSTIPELEVVPPMMGPPGPAPMDGWTGLAELAGRTGAGTVLSGAIHLDDDALRFQVRFADTAGGKLLPGPEPVKTSRSDPIEGLEKLRERVMTSLGPMLTQRAIHVRGAARPPGMDAYRAYLEGLERFIRGEWREALTHFHRSAELEPEYALPRVVSSIALWNLGELAGARATADEAATMRNSLPPFERAVLDMVQAWLDGDWAAAHRASAEQAEIAPGSIPHFQVAEEARRLNRLREARTVLRGLDPDSGELRGWIFYWVERTTVDHLLGDHADELEAARRARQTHPDDPVAILLEIRALAGLGRTADVVELVERELASPSSQPPLPGELLMEAGLEIRTHGPAGDGHGPIAQSLFGRAVAWYREHGDRRPSASMRRALARAHYHAGQHEEARQIFRELVEASEPGIQPMGYHHGHLQAHLDEGYLAVIAAREKDPDETVRWCSALEEFGEPFLYGAQWFWLAAVAAVRDDRERAVRLLRRAFAEGLPMEMFIHTDPHLARVRGYGPFDALMRPRQ